MTRRRVAVLGGGPAGHAAALAAAGAGASVTLFESERLGGSCVHDACIPANVALDAVRTSLATRELAFHGILDASDVLRPAPIALRQAEVSRTIAAGVAASLKSAGVEVVGDRAEVASPGLVTGGGREVDVDAVVVATGARWDDPVVPGVAAERILTPDLVHSLAEPPGTAVVLVRYGCRSAFHVEYAVLLAALGTKTTLVITTDSMVDGLDADLQPAVLDGLAALGIETLAGDHAGASVLAAADAVVVTDERRCRLDGLGAVVAAAVDGDRLPVDDRCRTAVEGVWAAGDVTGEGMVTAIAQHQGAVAGACAAGNDARQRRAAVPRLLHSFPQVGWVGGTESSLVAGGRRVVVGWADLSYNARAIALGGHGGLVKVIADAELGEILGVHAVGVEVAELLAVATAAMQAEVTVDQIAALVPWHPSPTEALVDAARACA